MSRAPSIVVVVVGALSMLGLVTQQTWLRGLGLLTAASPAPLVFSAFRSVETFAASFAVELERQDGSTAHLAVTPALYDELDGPYNRRNTYGAAISYGPALTEERERAMVDGVLRHGLCHTGPLARRFGETTPLRRATVVVTTLTPSAPGEWRRTVECAP